MNFVSPAIFQKEVVVEDSIFAQFSWFGTRYTGTCLYLCKYVLKKAGAELCQAQYKLELAKFWFCSVAIFKFDCLVQTGLVAIGNNQNLSLDKCWLDKCCTDRCCMDICCMDRCCMDKCFMVKLVLGHLSIVKDGSTSLKCPPGYFPWGLGKSWH